MPNIVYWTCYYLIVSRIRQVRVNYIQVVQPSQGTIAQAELRCGKMRGIRCVLRNRHRCRRLVDSTYIGAGGNAIGPVAERVSCGRCSAKSPAAAAVRGIFDKGDCGRPFGGILRDGCGCILLTLTGVKNVTDINV
ncbi:hypothetical protein REC12_14890 [Desulfosporosinus sp. PR]|nr:hypothetical protein [Desulfosporosinus sp. PR]MDQ7094882.1 hypothetical protein [Desulfosporosinus sp. PR]